MGFIYISTSPSRKSYIGQTIRTIEERFEEHQKPSKCVAFFRAIQKYGWENFDNHWYEVPDEDLNKHEELMIEVLGTLAPNGYNLTKGGANGSPSEISRQRMREAKQGEKHPMYGKKHTEETKQRNRESQQGEKGNSYGKTRTNSSKQKQSESTRGEKNRRSKKVYQYDLNDNFIRSFASTEEAARELNKNSGSTIRACARGDPGHKSVYGFKWSYNEP
jgi:group I intron endonuclease